MNAVSPTQVLNTVTDVCVATHQTGSILVRLLEAAFDMARALGYIESNPAASARVALPTVKARVKHRATCGYQGITEYIDAVRRSEAAHASKLLIEFIALTGVRTNEARLAEWSEVDLDEAV